MYAHRLDISLTLYAQIRHYLVMPKRVAINISLPDEAFKKAVLETAERLETTPSKEFVDLFERLFKRKS